MGFEIPILLQRPQNGIYEMVAKKYPQVTQHNRSRIHNTDTNENV